MARRIVPAAAGVPALEPIRQDLYDTAAQTIANPVATLDFFRTPGAGELNSNMQGSGQLPHPQQYHAFGICAEIFGAEGVEADEVMAELWAAFKKKLRETAWLRLRIGSKDYLTIPLKRVPEGMGYAGVGAGGTDVVSIPITNGVQDVQHYHDLTIKQMGKIKPIHIPAQQSFLVQVIWPALPPFADRYDFRIRVYLVGILWREVQ